MRNLKRALSLALAVVMVVGLMVVGAGAVSVEDFGDKAEIKNTEAVGLLVDLGVIQGGNDGNFSPKGTLTRGQFAKIAYLLSQVQTDFTRYAGTGVAKDAAGHWAEGALVWCNTWRNQIITGGSDGNFYPDDTLTVVQCAVMMLRVLGYNNYLEGFTGNGWEIRTLNKADEAGLMKGLESLKAGDPISRDDACLMAFNALLAKRVYHTEQWNPTAGTMVPTGYDKDYFDGSEGKKDTLLANTFKAEAATVEVAQFDDGKYKDGDGNEIKGLNITPDMIGTTVSYYKIGEKVLASSATSTATTMGTFDGAQWTAKTTARPGAKPEFTLQTAKEAEGTEGQPGYKPAVEAAAIYVNGEEGDATAIVAGSIVVMINTDADAEIELVHVTNKAVATVGEDGVTTETKGKDTTVTVDGVINTATNVKNVEGYADLKAGDVVLFVTLSGKTTIEKAEKVTGKVSAVSNDGVYTVGTNKLDETGLKDGSDGALTTGLSDTNFKDEYNFFLDNGGHVVAVTAAGDKPAGPTYKYGVVANFGLIKGTNSGALGSTATPDVFQAELIDTDGNSSIVEFTSIKIGNDTFKPNDQNNPLNETKIDNLKENNLGSLVKYTEKDGKYTLELVGESVDAGSLTGGKPVFTGTLIANKNTKFIVKIGTGRDAKIQAITGIANLPTSTQGDGKGGGITAGCQLTNADSGFVTLAYLEIPAVDGVVSKAQLAFFIDTDKYTKTAAGYVVKAIVDGKETELVVAAAEDGSMLTEAQSLKNKLVSVKYDKDGKVVEVSETITGMTELTDITAQGEFVKQGSNYYQLDSESVIYKIEGSKVSTVTPDKIGSALAEKENTTYNAYVELDEDLILTMYIVVVVSGG